MTNEVPVSSDSYILQITVTGIPSASVTVPVIPQVQNLSTTNNTDIAIPNITLKTGGTKIKN